MRRNHTARRSAIVLGLAGFAAAFAVGCDTQAEWLVTRFDPCLTVLVNCLPGSFENQFVESLPAYHIDPGCTIPGACAESALGVYDQFGPGFDGP